MDIVNSLCKLICSILIFSSCLTLISQNYNPEDLEQLIERISSEENTSISLDMIEYYIINPIDLNSSTEKQISSIPAISYDLAVRIINLIKQYPDIKFSVIKDSLFLSEDIFKLLELTTFLSDNNEKKEKKNIKLDVRTRYIPLINKIKGFEDGKYLGSPFYSYFRSRVNYNDSRAGILLTKDIGEKNLTEFIAGYLKFKTLGFDIILGDYTIHSGMGNILWNQYSFGKGAETIYPAVSFISNTNSYLSSSETNFFRGISISYDLNLSNYLNFKNSFWFSSRKLSGTLDISKDTITSVYNSGFFRTESEIKNKNNFSETILGFKSEISEKNFILGFSGFLLNYDKFINSQSRTVFYGKKGYLGSFYYLFNLVEVRLVGELSIDNNGKLALRSAINKSYDNFEFALSIRYFDDSFRSPFGFNFGDSPEVNNEVGIYTGLKWKISKSIIISSYFDFFKTLARTFFIPYFKHGQDFFIQSDWNIDTESCLRIRFNYESKTDNIIDNNGIRNYIQKAKYYSRIEYQRKLSKTFHIRLRSDFSLINFVKIKPDEIGFASSFELNYKPFPELLIQGRITKFDTESYESAIWQFESPVPGYMYSQLLYEQGWRAYLDIRYQMFNILNLALRYSITSKSYKSILGSGLNQIVGNQDKKFLLQISVNI